ncbi:DUF4132 domain-containing protein [Rufibacter glacialis]|uniref:DUF4132 domain-containing protein n=1 Tax=Rufibacter glacialis TaxID=1259555 RepID=A0A5M8QIG0_9BACT|nr:DUF4132 domain-containing protein [Rufibacter glacialis]KAA6435815.1 DUF4132 domain-containing protein [Rufibacter glacialis]GGK66810.1 hypothetical protein GCM10011405_13460 [Rufibacter glacialis]
MGIVDVVKKALSKKAAAPLSPFEELIDAAEQEANSKYSSFWGIKAKELNVFTERIINLPADEKVAFILECITVTHQWYKGKSSFSTSDKDYLKIEIRGLFLHQLLRTKLALSEQDIEVISQQFIDYRKSHWGTIHDWPLANFLTQVERNFKGATLTSTSKTTLLNLRDVLAGIENGYYEKERAKLIERIDKLLHTGEGEASIKPTYFLGYDDFSNYANPIIRQRPEQELTGWYKVMAHAQKASGGKPTQKYLKESQVLVTGLGAEVFSEVVLDWFRYIIHLKEKETVYTQTHGGHTYTYSNYEFISASNLDAIKGLVWMGAPLATPTTLSTLAALADRAFKKIPGKGPAAAAIGNACLFTLYKSEGLEGISHLSRLKLRIRQSSTQALIEKYLQEAAKEQGISVHEIEDLAVDQYGVEDGKRVYELEGFKAELEIVAIGKTELKWFKPDGNPQKSVPSIVKEKQPAALKQVKETAKQIEVSLSAQRDRLDRMFKADRLLSWAYFEKYYANHGLLSYLTKRLIWVFKKEGVSKNVIFFEGKWVGHDLAELEPAPEITVQLWHPATATMSEIEAWRRFLVEHQVLQPFKQAYREVYLLTDAEINTRVYSNRMAAHLLKQHQFNSLAKLRGWKYALLGAFDDGRYNEAASCLIPDFHLKAEYWVNEVDAEGEMNDTGIWNYIATDQLRFVDTQSNNVVELINIPRVILSEVLRDVDLFVGVATVGNDPNWRDSGGVPAYRDYWQAYSFGELSELAKTRKEILTQLLPRLKLANVAEIKDKFLVVRGKLRTYKIHLGSTNILMEPNDQYLCIVPDRSKKDITQNVFLPFEGDTGFSVILSKAMLLAEDDKITDSTITSQIKRF